MTTRLRQITDEELQHRAYTRPAPISADELWWALAGLGRRIAAQQGFDPAAVLEVGLAAFTKGQRGHRISRDEVDELVEGMRAGRRRPSARVDSDERR